MEATLQCILLLSTLSEAPVAALRVPASLKFEPPSSRPARRYLICGTKDALLSDTTKSLLPRGLPAPRWKYLVGMAESGAGGAGATAHWMFTASDAKPSTILAAVLPNACARHCSPVRPHAVTALMKGSTTSTDVLVIRA